VKRKPSVSEQATAKFGEDRGLAGRFEDLLATAQEADQALRTAQAQRAPLTEQRALALALDKALTEAMQAAYASQRVAIGPRGYDDRIFRRKARATSAVHAWTDEAERLLTLRETHRLTGIPRTARVNAA
jgi:hypothetical protein